ncbi:protein ORF16 [Anguillid herpesvirus 1]|uniref:Protein ORF16 n=1 Tax=Anguillid herpesvirus 1 TaxID=150286 RepID=A0A1J0RE89_9VIRU|nr:protein ORF16 [Anguillid herpesvirus 1]ADA57779.1 protein ORF16 [Anguillid herpesvirus 1]APD76179.1 ORF16 [Anguillid herpesvirus 1]QRM16311.1 protein ORF16 [Anguillid herpesvirus 1]QRM16570.1 protein ORF16 [Anguillid herpesvirus 1]QRM16703.1 protein ORF16 [Anguillid herpesvirus 1]
MNLWSWLKNKLPTAHPATSKDWQILIFWPVDKETSIPMATVEWVPLPETGYPAKLFKFQSFHWTGDGPSIQSPHCDYDEDEMPEMVLVLRKQRSVTSAAYKPVNGIQRNLNGRCLKFKFQLPRFPNDDDPMAIANRTVGAVRKRAKTATGASVTATVDEEEDWKDLGWFEFETDHKWMEMGQQVLNVCDGPHIMFHWPPQAYDYPVTENVAAIFANHLSITMPPEVVERVMYFCGGNDMMAQLVKYGTLRIVTKEIPEGATRTAVTRVTVGERLDDKQVFLGTKEWRRMRLGL